MYPKGIAFHHVLNAYANGLFPMGDDAATETFYWYDPPVRALLPIAGLHIPRRLARTVRQFPYTVRIDTAFPAVIDACAAAGSGRERTWINRPIQEMFADLHRAGFAHSVECWEGKMLVGGLYGLALGGAFMGESMFSRARDASKIALVHLCARLWQAEFSVLDTQFVNDHLKQFGVYEVPKITYLERLHAALDARCDFSLSGVEERSLVSSYLLNRVF
ncbi:MAG: leucyl/phenylalanyl-tRNA--protein transferase [Alphaproteobacteria bacterium]|nr:leucyl/phenylalanyl-tRNA--protein transferase [Alphaproteobacteria bacterium]